MKNNNKQEPIYFKIYNYLKSYIFDTKLKPGDILPSERDLVKTFNTSRSTVRQALKELEDENMIFKVHGKGNFVSGKTIDQDLNIFYSFHEKVKSIGKVPSSKLIFHEIIKANLKFSEIFKIPLGSDVIHLVRLRLIDNEPIMYEDTFLPAYRFDNFKPEKLNKKSMYNIFRKEYKVSFNKAIESFKPYSLKNKQILEHLNYDEDEVLLMKITRETYEFHKIIEYTKSFVKNDIFEYKVILNNLPLSLYGK